LARKKSKRTYREEYIRYHSSKAAIKRRSLRNQARRKMGLKVGDPREVDHIKPLSKMSAKQLKNCNNKKNLRVVSRKTNRKKGNRTR